MPRGDVANPLHAPLQLHRAFHHANRLDASTFDVEHGEVRVARHLEHFGRDSKAVASRNSAAPQHAPPPRRPRRVEFAARPVRRRAVEFAATVRVDAQRSKLGRAHDVAERQRVSVRGGMQVHEQVRGIERRAARIRNSARLIERHLQEWRGSRS